jgi:hypothetical protein
MPGPSYLFGCMPCHNGEVVSGNMGGSILDSLTYGPLFTDPNLGEIPRPIINCEACHISGVGHFGGSSPPEVPIPAFHQCTECHPPTDAMLSIAAFSGADHTDHHGPYSTHMWAYGGTVVDDLLNFGDPSPIFGTTLTVASRFFEAYALSATWLAANGDTWYFDGHETINDTHYQGIWVTNIPNELVVYRSDRSKFGYVDLTNTSTNTGMVRADSVDSCTASCHGAHKFDLTINEQWFHGAHNIEPLGPVNEMYPFGPVLPLGSLPKWMALEYPFSSKGFDPECRRCHSSEGFAEVAPDFGTPDGYGGGLITCNACHDGVNYPTPADKRLRFSGAVPLFDSQGVPLANVEAGRSAVCVYCHQGLEDGSHIDDDIASGSPQFRNMHYLAAGAMLYAKKGYEYSGTTYSQEHIHTLVGCVACHMAEGLNDEMGGHTFHMKDDALVENKDLCLQTCHPSMSALNDPFGTGPDAANDIAYMLTVLLHNAIEVYDSPADIDTLPNIDYSASHPYFGTASPGQEWDGPAAKATFNWQFVYKDPGAFAHNPDYALQLLWDSYEDLYINDNSISPAPGVLLVTRP